MARSHPTTQSADENPEWTAVEVKRARPALDVIGEAFGPHVAEELRTPRTPMPGAPKR